MLNIAILEKCKSILQRGITLTGQNGHHKKNPLYKQ